MRIEPLRWPLADGRELLFFSLPGHAAEPLPDRRALPARAGTHTELRLDRQTGEWVVIAALRQHRTYKPAPDQCPLCPGPSGISSEVPAPDYDVVVFENRFPSLAGDSAQGLPDTADAFMSAPGTGQCEVIAFSSNHTGSFADLDAAQALLVVQAWRHRTAELMARPGIAEVFCFENRGEEIGVTLTHPHGQIYAYPYVTPRTATMLRQARLHRERHGTNLFERILADELEEGARIVAQNGAFTAFVPFASRWPLEVHIYPNRFVRNLTGLDDAELESFARIYLDVLGRFDRLYDAPLPYMSALHQYTDDDGQREGYFHVELLSIRRTANKIKYLASSESAMGAFINDTTPEIVAGRLREL